MNEHRNQSIKAVGLLSGGLDSMLAIRIMLEQGVAVTALYIRTGFAYVNRDEKSGTPLPSDAERAAQSLGVPLVTLDVSESYVPLVLEPRYGYGSGMNPCVDCRIFLLQQAKRWMEDHDHQFVFTGEVVGQRPKSQMPPTLRTVERESGLTGYLLRPLSAKLLDPTIPEQRGWVDRERLYAINGRGRKEQIALAERFGITDYAQPSGGCCYLIQKVYSRRLRDFLDHEGQDALTVPQAQLLAMGRHFRLPSGLKVVIGRHEAENAYLLASEVLGVRLNTPHCPGPVTLIPGQPTQEEIAQAARMTAGYSDGHTDPQVLVAVHHIDGRVDTLSVAPLKKRQVRSMMV